MPRKVGDKNYSAREHKLKADISTLKSKNAAQKAQIAALKKQAKGK